MRSTWFAQNFSESYFLEGYWRVSSRSRPATWRSRFVDAEDIADVAVAALTEDGHVGQLYELTGPRLLTFREAVEVMARATGRDLRYAPVALDEFATAMVAQDVPIDLLTYLFGEVLDGRNAHLADGVERALGRPPRDFSDYARRRPRPASGARCSLTRGAREDAVFPPLWLQRLALAPLAWLAAARRSLPIGSAAQRPHSSQVATMYFEHLDRRAADEETGCRDPGDCLPVAG